MNPWLACNVSWFDNWPQHQATPVANGTSPSRLTTFAFFTSSSPTVKVPAPQEDVFHTISTVKAKALIHTTDRQRTVVVAVMGEEVEMQDLVEKAVYVLFLCFQLLPSDGEVVVLRNVRNDLFANLAADSWQSSEFVRHANMDGSLDLGAGVDVDVVALDQVAVYLVAYFARQEKERRDLSVGQLTVSVS